MSVLHRQAILDRCEPTAKNLLTDLEVLQQTASTNTELMNRPEHERHGCVILAEMQSKGRGRRQRNWHSPAGGNLYMSVGWNFSAANRNLSALPLVVALAVAESLNQCGLKGHGIKWPNDIECGGRKLAGILVEMQSFGSGGLTSVIGIGLNVRMPAANDDSIAGIERPWTDLRREFEKDSPNSEVPSRDWLAAAILSELLPCLRVFEAQGFAPFETEWKQFDCLAEREVRVEQAGKELAGIARGIDQDGALKLAVANGGIQMVHSGEVSVRYV